MRPVYHRISAAALALLIVFATLSYRLDLHFCGSHLVDISLDGNLDACGMLPSEGSDTKACGLQAMSCCSDVEITQSGQDTTPVELSQVDVEQSDLLHQPTYHPFAPAVVWQRSDFPPYEDPPRIRDLSVWNQVFLL